MKNAVVGMYKMVFVVILIVDIQCEHGRLHSLFYIVVVMSTITFFFASRLLRVSVRLCNLAGAPCPASDDLAPTTNGDTRVLVSQACTLLPSKNKVGCEVPSRLLYWAPPHRYAAVCGSRSPHPNLLGLPPM